MTITKPHATHSITEYEVSYLPEEHNAYPAFVVRVVYKGRGLWAVEHAGASYSADAAKSYEPVPSARDDEWRDRHRFDLQNALDIAEEVAMRLRVNGYSVLDVLDDKHLDDD
jgi:hypothetical protein